MGRPRRSLPVPHHRVNQKILRNKDCRQETYSANWQQDCQMTLMVRQQQDKPKRL